MFLILNFQIQVYLAGFNTHKKLKEAYRTVFKIVVAKLAAALVWKSKIVWFAYICTSLALKMVLYLRSL